MSRPDRADQGGFLFGYRVLDLTDERGMADLGADVVQVEPPGGRNGSGWSSNAMRRKAHHTYPSCGGRGRHPRLGVRVLQPAHYNQLTVGLVGHKRIDKRGS